MNFIGSILLGDGMSNVKEWIFNYKYMFFLLYWNIEVFIIMKVNCYRIIFGLVIKFYVSKILFDEIFKLFFLRMEKNWRFRGIREK